MCRTLAADPVRARREASRHVDVDSDCVRIDRSGSTVSQLLDERRTAHRFLADLASGHDPALRPHLTAD